MKKIKCFIINRDLVTWPKSMIKWMETTGEIEPIIIDNDSTYQPTLDWYETNPCKIHRLTYNGGHTVLWNSGILLMEVKEGDLYIITDPDLDLSTVPLDVVSKLKSALDRDSSLPKCGLAIKLDDIPDEFPLKNQVHIWETPFWSSPIGDDFYMAPTDTTFALCRTRNHCVGGWRVGGPYTCRHLPFYITPTNIDEELAQYFEKCNKQVSTMARVLDPLVQDYRRNEKE